MFSTISRSESKTVINWQDYEGRQALHCAVTESTDAVVAAIIKYLVLNQVLHMMNTQVPFLHAERAGQPFAVCSTLGGLAWKTLGLSDAARSRSQGTWYGSHIDRDHLR